MVSTAVAGKGLGGGMFFPGGIFLVLRGEGLTSGWEGACDEGACSDVSQDCCWEALPRVSLHLEVWKFSFRGTANSGGPCHSLPHSTNGAVLWKTKTRMQGSFQLSHSLPTAASWLLVLVTSQSMGSLPSWCDDGVFQAIGRGAEDGVELCSSCLCCPLIVPHTPIYSSPWSGGC